MGDIEMRRKKGRPSKADLARRAAADHRRSSRRRSVNYCLDLIDDSDDEDRRRREKKLKVLLRGGDSRRVSHAPPVSDGDDVAEEIEEEGEDSSAEASVRERKTGSNDADSVPGTPPDLPRAVPLPEKETLEMILDKLQKKDTYGVYAVPVDPDELPDYHDVIEHPMDFATVRKKLGKGSYSTLEQFESDVLLICSNAMQYNAPDTIYYKQAFSIQELAKRKFQRLRFGDEQYEKELKSEQKPTSNSLGTNRKTRMPITRVALGTVTDYGKELQSEQKPTSNSLGTNRQMMPITRGAPETVAPDHTSSTTLATFGDLQPESTTKLSGVERLSNVDESVDGTSIQSDYNLEKAEDLLSGRGHISRCGRKSLVHDDNHRATYNISTQPVSRPESPFPTFDDEIKQLLAVGLHADHSYARSLARFAAMLGPVAWNIASKRIEQALPPGIKFGRGWVGDYEPISTPVLVMQKCSQKETLFCEELNVSSNRNKDEKKFGTARSMHKNPIVAPTSQGKSTLFASAVNSSDSSTSYSFPSKPQPLREEMLDMKPNIAASLSYQVQSPRARNTQPEKRVKKRVELNSTPPSDQSPHEFSSAKQIPNGTNISGSKSVEPLSRDMNLPVSVPLKQPLDNGFIEVMNGKWRNYDQRHCEFLSVSQISNGTSVPGSKSTDPLSWEMSHPVSVPLKQPQNNEFIEVTTGKSQNNNFDINRTMAPVNSDCTHMSIPANDFPPGHDQSLTDPVQLMRSLRENAQKQHKSMNHSTTDNPLVPSSTKEDPSNASSAAARAWMSIGAGSPKLVSGSLNNRNQIFVNSLHSQISQFRNDSPISGMHFHPMNINFPIQGSVAPQFRTGNEAQFQNQPPMVFPQLVTTDLSRFQMQSSPRQGQHLQIQPSQKRETTIPPDLNLVFQSSGSPGRQTSGLPVDSQQPDLALQL